jgi:hypothetical protein
MIENIVKCVTGANLSVAELVAEPLATADAVLTEEEEELGVLLIDIGGEVVKIWVEGGANDLFGRRQDNGKLKEAAVALRHPQLHALQCEGAGRDLRLDRRPFEILTLRLLRMGQ